MPKQEKWRWTDSISNQILEGKLAVSSSQSKGTTTLPKQSGRTKAIPSNNGINIVCSSSSSYCVNNTIAGLSGQGSSPISRSAKMTTDCRGYLCTSRCAVLPPQANRAKQCSARDHPSESEIFLRSGVEIQALTSRLVLGTPQLPVPVPSISEPSRPMYLRHSTFQTSTMIQIASLTTDQLQTWV